MSQHKLPTGMNLSVPDLGQLRPTKDPIAIKVQPGDHVMVLLPQQASAQEVGNLSAALRQWAPGTEFLVLSGPESITVIPAPIEEDKAPQGQNDKQSDCTCKGDYHYAGSNGLCYGE